MTVHANRNSSSDDKLFCSVRMILVDDFMACFDDVLSHCCCRSNKTTTTFVDFTDGVFFGHGVQNEIPACYTAAVQYHCFGDFQAGCCLISFHSGNYILQLLFPLGLILLATCFSN